MQELLRRVLILALLAASSAAAERADKDVYEDVMSELTSLEQALPEMELSFYGSSAAGRRLPFAVVNRDRQFTAKRLKRTGRPLVLILAGVHGDEPRHAGLAGRFLREVRAGEHQALLESANFLLVPALNVDGLPASGSSGRRRTPAGLDLDRDWLKLEAEETRSLVAIVNGWHPHLVIDLHGGHGADLAAHGGARVLRPASAGAGGAWLERALAGRGEAVSDAEPGSSLGYFAARRLPIVRIDAEGDDAGYGVVLHLLAAVAADGEALQQAMAEDEKAAPSKDAVAGYVVLPGWQRLERALREHGIAGERLVAPQKLVADSLLLHTPRFAPRPEEGLTRVSVAVRAESGVRVLPTGSLWIPADQPLREVVRAVLEPVAPESLVSWGLLSSLFTGEGSETQAPILRAARRPSGETRPWH